MNTLGILAHGGIAAEALPLGAELQKQPARRSPLATASALEEGLPGLLRRCGRHSGVSVVQAAHPPTTNLCCFGQKCGTVRQLLRYRASLRRHTHIRAGCHGLRREQAVPTRGIVRRKNEMRDLIEETPLVSRRQGNHGTEALAEIVGGAVEVMLRFRFDDRPADDQPDRLPQAYRRIARSTTSAIPLSTHRLLRWPSTSALGVRISMAAPTMSGRPMRHCR